MAHAKLRDRIRDIQSREPASRRYSRALKLEVVAHCEAREQDGASIIEVATELALPLSTLSKWVRHARRRRAAGQGGVLCVSVDLEAVAVDAGAREHLSAWLIMLDSAAADDED